MPLKLNLSTDNYKAKNMDTEKSCHQIYLDEFRTQQCSLFLEHKCPNHRPYNCFNWHFPNQKRRRPVKQNDGTFNYNPDVYCQKYDENSGFCPDEKTCPYVHRNAGDTERRYHPRYYKTSICIYESENANEKSCVRNGLHCAFAHGDDDIRQPTLDIREINVSTNNNSNYFPSTIMPITGLMKTINQNNFNNSNLRVTPTQCLSAALEQARVLTEDPRWADLRFVLLYYKTKLCPRALRTCRQGYACPYYHNLRDRRRDICFGHYNGTPCQSVKSGDAWLEPELCELGDNCPNCHTRTEQQFHPLVYKTASCKDMVLTGSCPRGSFCAFTHNVEEEKIGRNFLSLKEICFSSVFSLPQQFFFNSYEHQKSLEDDNLLNEELQRSRVRPFLCRQASNRKTAFDMQSFLDHALDDDSPFFPLNLDILNNLPEDDQSSNCDAGYYSPSISTTYCSQDAALSPSTLDLLPDESDFSDLYLSQQQQSNLFSPLWTGPLTPSAMMSDSLKTPQPGNYSNSLSFPFPFHCVSS